MPKRPIRHKCRLCGSNTVHLLEMTSSLEGSFGGKLGAEDLMLDFLKCESCDLLQLPNIRLKASDSMSFSHLQDPSLSALRREQVENLKSIVSSPKLVIDIGCGDGMFLHLFEGFAKRQVGFEGNPNDVSTARKQGLEIVESYLNAKSAKKFFDLADVVLCTQVLEHIDKPRPFLKLISKLLTENGVLLLEVPCGEDIFNHRRYYSLMPEHLSYFHTQHLAQLLSIDFEILQIRRTFEGQYLEVLARKPKVTAAEFGKNWKTFQRTFEQKLRLAKGRRLAMWGLGAKGLALLHAFPTLKSQLDFVVESNPAKHDSQSFPPIVGPDFLQRRPVEVLLISAVSYERAIRDQLSKLGWKGEIWLPS